MSSSNRRQFIQRAASFAGGMGCAKAGLQSASANCVDVSPDDYAKLRAKIRGRLVLPGDDSYETAKRVFYWNPKLASRPAVVVQCGHEEDAIRAVDFARRFGLELAVRSGGHSYLAWGSSNGMVIDLSPLKQISIDPRRQIVRAEGGVVGGEVSRAAAAFGMVPVLGQCPGVGATGLTLGGGLGWLSGLFGASCDQLVSTRMVTEDARFIEVDAESDPELFWGLQGAGANFGVTTSFEARLKPLGTVLAGDLFFSVRDARAVLRGFREIMQEAPDAFQAAINLTPGERGVFIGLSHAGDERDAEQLFQKVRSLAKPTKVNVNRQPFADLAEKAAATSPVNIPAPTFRAIQTVYRDAITDDIIDIYVDQLTQAPPDVILGLSHYMHGEVCRIQSDATAFPHRKEHSVHLRVAYNWSDPRETDARFAWGENWLKLLRPVSNENLYANYQTYETAAGSPSLFGLNHPRLLALKKKHDPENFFRRNANIAPAKT